MPLLLYRLQGLTPLSKHLIMVNLSLSDGQFWFLHLLLDHSLTTMWSTVLRSGSQSPDCQDFLEMPLRQDHSMSIASGITIPSLTVQRTLTQGQESHLITSGAISSATITHASYIIKGESFLTCVWIVKPLLVCPAWKKL